MSWVLFVAFIYGRLSLIPPSEPLIQGSFSMADITLYIIMSFVTNLPD